MGNRAWNTAEDEVIRLVHGKESLASIGKRLGRTESAVAQHIALLGFRTRHGVSALATRVSETCEFCGRLFIPKFPNNPNRFCGTSCKGRAETARLGSASTPEARLKDSTHIPNEGWKLGYIAAFLDGEGSITIRRGARYGVVQIAFTNTHLQALQWIQTELGGGGMGSPEMRPGSTKPCYHLYYEARRETQRLLTAILPYLIIKKEKARVALDLLAEWNDGRSGSAWAPGV